MKKYLLLDLFKSKASILATLLFTFAWVIGYSQPANDLCSGATPIVPSPQGTGCATPTFTLPFASDGTTDSGVPTVCSTPGNDNWYTWTATSTGLFFSSQSPGNPGIAIFASCADADAGIDIACGGTFSSPNLSGWNIGDNLIIQIYDFSGSSSDVAFCLEEFTPPLPPANNDCANAEALTVNADDLCGTVTPGTIASATASGEDETTCGGTEDDDVWYSFVATNTEHTIDLLNVANGTTDLYHSLWSGTCGALTNILCSDPNSSTATGLTVGTTYLLRVYSWTGTAGQTSTFDVCIGTLPPPPMNDNCANAISITNGGSLSGSTNSATNVEGLTPCSGGTAGASCPTGVNDGTIDFGAGLWYVYTSTGQEAITIEVNGFDTELQVFTGPCGSFTCVAGDDDSSSAGCCGSQVCFDSDASFAPVDYYIYVDGHGTATGTFDLTLNAAVLPVELVSFEGKVMDKGNLLQWSTAMEDNAEYHIIERSIDGNTWREISRVNAVGFSTELNSYEIMDMNPFAKSYYRLQSLDFDGQYEYSEVISLTRTSDESEIHNVYPNPAGTNINIDYTSLTDGNVSIEIYDISGQLVYTLGDMQVQKGMNVKNIDISQLNAGVYMMKLNSNTESDVIRFVKN